MDLNTFLTQQIEILSSIRDCLEREKQALIQEDAGALLEIIEEKKRYINTLEQVEKKREETYPGINLSKLEAAGLLTNELKVSGEKMRSLAKEIEELQETNQLLTRQSLLYTNKMISILQGNKKATYSASGKVEDYAGKSILDQSI